MKSKKPPPPPPMVPARLKLAADIDLLSGAIELTRQNRGPVVFIKAEMFGRRFVKTHNDDDLIVVGEGGEWEGEDKFFPRLLPPEQIPLVPQYNSTYIEHLMLELKRRTAFLERIQDRG